MSDAQPIHPHRPPARPEAAYLRSERGALLGALLGALVGLVIGWALTPGEPLESIYGAGTGALLGGCVGAGLGCASALRGRGAAAVTGSLTGLLLTAPMAVLAFAVTDAEPGAYVVVAAIALPVVPVVSRWLVVGRRLPPRGA